MKLKWISRLAAVVGVLVLTVVATNADEGSLSLRAKLTGLQESPPKLSPSTGTVEATVLGSTLSYKLTYSKLSSPAFMAHIHFAQPAVNGGIFLWLCGSAAAPGPAGTPTCPPDGGTVSRSGITAADIQAVSGQNLSAGDFAGALSIIRNGDAYVNVHTTSVSPVPNGASETLEYAFDDFSVAQFARSIGRSDIYRRFRMRAENWATLFETSSGLVMPRDADGAFWLQTPAERGRIQVEDAPFVAVELDWGGAGRDQKLSFRTNIDQIVTAGPDHPIRVAHDILTCEPTPYLQVRSGEGSLPIEARIGRAVYYELVALAVPCMCQGRKMLGVWSCGRFFPLGELPPGAGVTTGWPRLQGQRNCGELVPADSAVSKVFARTATTVYWHANVIGCATSLSHTLSKNFDFARYSGSRRLGVIVAPRNPFRMEMAVLAHQADLGAFPLLAELLRRIAQAVPLLIGILNTLKVAVVGCVLATIVGTLIGIGRLSRNWLVARLTAIYVEALRDVPLPLQLLFWYGAKRSLPSFAGSFSPVPGFFWSNRGLTFPLLTVTAPDLWVLGAFLL